MKLFGLDKREKLEIRILFYPCIQRLTCLIYMIEKSEKVIQFIIKKINYHSQFI